MRSDIKARGKPVLAADQMEVPAMTSQQLEARIKKLCEAALKAELECTIAVGAELEYTIQELRAALHEHNELLKKLEAKALLRNQPPRADSSSRKRNGN